MRSNREPLHRLRAGRAFTLVELLVIVGIIAVLISLLMPALSKAYRYAHVVVCASQMRQVGQAMMLYTSDNRGRLPYAYLQYPNLAPYGSQFTTWDDLLNKYLGANVPAQDLANIYTTRPMPVLVCPEDPFDRSLTYYLFQARTYSMVEAGGGSPWYAVDVYGMAAWQQAYTAGWGPNPKFRCFQITDAPASSETLLVAENPGAVNILGHYNGSYVDRPADQGLGLAAPIHDGRWNYLFVDGHVSLMLPKETIRAPATVTDYAPTLNYMWTRDPND